ncbi:YtxH domain-containing protein [Maribacter aestuarii]|uniref:YtxH domain-containing protein n=1 Tax=Maribacter aestuarii TaxID=1130723 RepID=UPI00248BC5F9|nr:YtxH domain-containing protein [Maribacter aestuarii]
MSEENKDLGDEANEAMKNAKKKAENLGDKAKDSFDKGKEETKDLGDKAEEAFDDAKEKTKEFTEDTKKKAKEFTEDTKKKANEFGDKAEEAAKDFKEDVKQTFDPKSPDSGKTVAILAHITIIGWIVAIIMNSQNKTEFGSYYIRQTLGIWIIAIILNFIPVVGCFASLICLVLIIISLVNAANDKMVPTVGVGHLFQDWFKSL